MKNIPYGKQSITEEDIESVVSVLRSEFITQGDVVPTFEEKIKEIVDAPYAIAVNSATSALHIACMAIGLGKGDWLWTSSTSFVASANCGLYCGAEIDFVDITLNTGLINPKVLKEKLEDAKRKNRLPKIIVVVHLAGTSCEMKTIREITQNYGIKIIEDASHAIGGSYMGNPVGNCRYSDITIFSFHPVKIITTGEGGLATTRNQEYAESMRLLRSHGIEKNKDRFVGIEKDGWKYEQQYLGMNYRMTDIQAALGLSQAKRLSRIIEERNSIYIHYRKEFARRGLPVRIMEIPSNVKSALHLCVIQLHDKEESMHRDLFSYLRNNGIGVQLHYSPIHLQPYYRKMGFRKGDLPNSEMYEKISISIPIYPGLKKEEQNRVVDIISSFFALK